MKQTINQEKTYEILLERLIMMVGKTNERCEHLHNRILHLERILLDDATKLQSSQKKISL